MNTLGQCDECKRAVANDALTTVGPVRACPICVPVVRRDYRRVVRNRNERIVAALNPISNFVLWSAAAIVLFPLFGIWKVTWWLVKRWWFWIALADICTVLIIDNWLKVLLGTDMNLPRLFIVAIMSTIFYVFIVLLIYGIRQHVEEEDEDDEFDNYDFGDTYVQNVILTGKDWFGKCSACGLAHRIPATTEVTDLRCVKCGTPLTVDRT